MPAHPKPPRTQLGRNIRSARHKACVSTRQAADALTVPISTFRSYEAGVYMPKPHVLSRIAETLQTTVEELLDGADLTEYSHTRDYNWRTKVFDSPMEAIRSCLSCGNDFESEGPSNRMCLSCKSADRHYALTGWDTWGGMP